MLEGLSKSEKYDHAFSSIQGVSTGEPNLTSNLANAAAILKEVFGWWWVGFYLVDNNELVLGPFQGPVACTRISYGKGVCGTAWEQRKTLVVDNVHEFPGHIACSAASNSEIVLPVTKNGDVVAVLDADSEFFSTYDDVDRKGLEKICNLIVDWF